MCNAKTILNLINALPHLENHHLEEMNDSIEALQEKVGVAGHSQEVLLSSVYNEAIAISTRKGAPVASYSIHLSTVVA